MKIKEFLKSLRQKTLSELLEMQKTKQKELVNLVFEPTDKKVKDVWRRHKIKHQLAQIKTIISEKTEEEIDRHKPATVLSSDKLVQR